jgi:hypothetical protein
MYLEPAILLSFLSTGITGYVPPCCALLTGRLFLKNLFYFLRQGLCSTGCPSSHNSPASASRVLGLWACPTTPIKNLSNTFPKIFS